MGLILLDDTQLHISSLAFYLNGPLNALYGTVLIFSLCFHVWITRLSLSVIRGICIVQHTVAIPPIVPLQK